MQDEPLPDLMPATRYDDRLRQVPADRAFIEAAVARASQQLAGAQAHADRPVQMRLHGYIGNALRLLGQHADAVQHLDAALTLARAMGNERAEVANLIRLGEAEKYGDKFVHAEALFRAALTRAQSSPALHDYQDFALQHLGKCLQERGDRAGAVECLQRALALREAKADPALIESTRQALRLAKGPGSG